MIKFPRIELYLPLSNDAILCQCHYYVPNFKFLAPPLTITPLPPPTIRILSIDFPDFKLVSAIFYKIFIFSQNDSPLKTMKNVYFI